MSKKKNMFTFLKNNFEIKSRQQTIDFYTLKW